MSMTVSRPCRIIPFPGAAREGPAAVPPTCKIIPFPGIAWEAYAPEPEYTPPVVSLNEHCENFKGIGFSRKILWALWGLKIHSPDELAKTPPAGILTRHRIGPKTLERIRAALESRGFTLGGDWRFQA